MEAVFPTDALAEVINMDAGTIGALISSIGFPILACIYMARWVTKQMDCYREDIKEMQKEHKEEIGKVTEALNNNTRAVIELSDYIKRKDDENV